MNDKELFAQYVEKMESFEDDRFSNMARDLFKGHNSYLRMKFKGSSIFNPAWINTIEDCLYELGQIINNPREVTTQEGIVTPIELAKKVNHESVRHLASHSQYVKDINEAGEVVPAKILGQFNKEEIHTYENRFIATFIRRLILFVEKRYEFIKKTVNLDEKDVMYVKNKSIVDGQEVEIETKISVKRAIEDDLAITAREYIARIDKLKQYVTYYYNSPFMKEFKTEKNVRKPILQTNIIRKNPLYHKCYETFLFIEKFDSLGVAFKVDRNFKAFSEKERKAINYIMLSNLLSLESSESARSYKKTSKSYKPKLLTSIDDESFLYGDLVKGPIEFVRSDEAYLNYLKAISPKDIPLRPNTGEKAYFKEEIKQRKVIHDEVKEIEALLARVQRQIAKYEKMLEGFIAKRDEEDAKEARKELERLRAEEQNFLNQKREAIIRAAMEQVSEVAKPIKKNGKKKPVKDAPIAEENSDKPVLNKKELKAQEAKERALLDARQEEIRKAELEAINIEEEEKRIAQEKEAARAAEEAKKAEEARLKAEEEARIAAEKAVKLEAERIAKEEAEKAAEEEAKRKAEEEAKKLAEEETRKAEEQEALRLQEEAKRAEEEVKAAEEAKKMAEEEAKATEEAKKAAEEEAKLKAEQEAKKAAEEEARIAAEKAAKEKAEKEALEAKKAEEEAKIKAEAEAKKAAEKEAKRKAKEEAKLAAQKAKEEKELAKKAKQKEKAAKLEENKRIAEKIEEEKDAKAKSRKKIPGSFIVKTRDEGYYVNEHTLSKNKEDAFIFDDFNLANDIKARLGGKVVKL